MGAGRSVAPGGPRVRAVGAAPWAEQRDQRAAAARQENQTPPQSTEGGSVGPVGGDKRGFVRVWGTNCIWRLASASSLHLTAHSSSSVRVNML